MTPTQKQEAIDTALSALFLLGLALLGLLVLAM